MKKRLISVLIVLALLGGTAAATAGVVTYTLTRAEYPVLINGEAMSFTDAVPMEYEGRTMLPVRAVAEALGVPINWNEDKRQVEIETLDIEALKKSCVMVTATNSIQKSQGSGVVLDYGKVLTCHHVINGYSYYGLQYNGLKSEVPCTSGPTASYIDAAILYTEDKAIKPVKIGDSDEVRVGDTIYVISSPDGKKNVVTNGKVKYTNIKINGLLNFVTESKSIPGSSGGACFNSRGELVGIVTAGDEDETCIIPINDIRRAFSKQD